MKLFVIACLIAAAAAAPPVASSGGASVISYENSNIGVGDYAYEFAQDDGTKGSAKGELKNANSEDAFYAVKGTYEWIGQDGVNYNLLYTADETGFHPVYTQGAGGAIPAEVLKSLG